MKVYLVTTNWSGWEDPEANGLMVEVFDSEEKAVKHTTTLQRTSGRKTYKPMARLRQMSLLIGWGGEA